MPVNYNFTENGVAYSFDDVFIPKELFRDANLLTWGRNNNGQLGIDNTNNRSTPVTTFAGGTDWKQVSSGNDYTAAIKTDGTLWTWGIGNNGVLGDNTTISRSVPVTTFAGGTDWKQVSSGTNHTAAIKTDGTLWTWGSAGPGILGNNATVVRSTPVTTFVGGNDWKVVDAGRQHTAAIKTDGTLWVWGSNSKGELGINNTFSRSIPVTTFAGGTNWKQVSCSKQIQVNQPIVYTAAIKTDGTLWTWGSEATNGNLGVFYYGGQNDAPILTPITTFVGGNDWKEVYCENTTFAIKTNGTLWTWGGNYADLLRKDTLNERLTPITTFAGGTNWADTPTTNAEDLYTITSGNSVTSAIKQDGTLWIWGYNVYGELGSNTPSSFYNIATPITTFAGGTNWKQVSSGSQYTAAIKTDGTLWTWGRNDVGQLGINNLNNRSVPVTTFAGGTNWKQVSSGNAITAAIKTDGTLWTWGRNHVGQIGDNTTISRSVPVTTFAGGSTAGGNGWKQVSCGSGGNTHVAAIKEDGTLWLWGENDNGKLGDRDIKGNINILTPITTFAGGTNWKQVSSGSDHTEAIKTDGTLWTWGRNDVGQLGINNLNNRSVPVTTFAGGTNWKQVSSGNDYTAAIKTDGTLWVWGYNGNGELGINNTNNRSVPVTTFAGGTNWKQVSAFKNTVALRGDGTNLELYVMGADFYKLGIPDPRSIPEVEDDQSTNWKSVSNSVAIKTDGTLWTWGYNGYGQLATNDATTRFTPVTTFLGGSDWKQVSGGFNHTAAIRYLPDPVL